MPGTLAEIFTYPGDPTTQVFYNSISTCTNSMQCHVTILELFMNALKINSKSYRAGVFTPDPNIPAIPDQATLFQLLAYIPEEIQDPYWMILYEQWNAEAAPASIGNFAFYIRTYTGAAIPADLTTAFNCVRCVYYADVYNELVAEYAVKRWAGTPAVIANVSPQNPGLTPQSVSDSIMELHDWIMVTDPEIVALTNLSALNNIATMLNAVFGLVPNVNISINLFCQNLVSAIQENGDTFISSTMAKTVFFNTVAADIDTDPFWEGAAITKDLALSFVTPLKKDSRYWGKSIPNNVKAFGIISQLFDVALTSSDAATKANACNSVGKIFTDFAATVVGADAYLLAQLQSTCTSLKTIVNSDPAMLQVYSNEITTGQVPVTIHYSDIEALMDKVDDVIQAIPLQYNNLDVRLFPFSNYDNLKSKAGVSFVNGTDKTTNDIEVLADAAEKPAHSANPIRYSRPISGVFTDQANGNATFLKFFNFDGTSTGDFYFQDYANPSLVQCNGFSKPPAPLFFDFKAVTINDLTKAPDTNGGLPIGTNYAIPTIKGNVSKINFCTAVKAQSKWVRLETQRNYDVVYETVFSSAGPSVALNPHLIWYTASGDLNRTDTIDESLCAIEWLAPPELVAKYPKLWNILGLPATRFISSPDISMLSLFGGDTTWVMDYIPVRELTGKENAYALVNTPGPNLPAELDEALNRGAGTSTSLNADAKVVMQLFNFAYYRQIFRKKIVKWVPSKNKPSSPANGELFGSIGPDGRAVIGIAPPVSFRLDQNLKFFKNYTAPNGPAGAYLKNKGNPLFRQKGKRLAAGSVMANIVPSIGVPVKPPLVSSSLSATTFGNWVLSQSEETLAEWNALKNNSRGSLPTDQEWCHLLGHGDGGDERLGNFASGSFHCNTEQLAMESKGRRSVTQSMPKGTFQLRSTAYLFNDEQSLLSQNYLKSDFAYQKMIKIYGALKKNSTGKSMRTDGAGKVTPLAALMRYKIYSYTSGGDGAGNNVENKLFDHVFEGQSEFIDQHQFNILKHAAWFAVAGMAEFDKWYLEQTGVAAASDAAMA